ncbi:MAG TPA: PLP-dependent aminotransferase family protein [Solirubrobacteraceae bacterium]|nr:PLP-dependent aminotransferase family protein [Solirubrobacteraceae bacterium]
MDQINGANSSEILIQLEDLSAAIGNWRARTGPTYTCLAAALADAAAQGHLAIGSRLPAERALAGHLGVSRGTVVAAYDALRAQRIARTRQGSGTVLLAGARATPPRRSPLLSLLVEGRRAPIDMAIGAPDIDLPDLSVSLRDAASLAPSHGYVPLGIAPLREAIADRMTRDGVSTSCEQIVVTSGGQGALSLIAATLLRPGDRVLVEAPTYPAAIEVFASSGAIVEGLDRDDAGIVPEALERAVARGPVRLLYVIPTCHNPTGGVMSEIRRREVSAIAQRRGITIVEDTVLEPMLLARPAPPAISSIEPAGVLAIGSLSKSVWGGLRIGWIRASSETVLRLGRVKAAADMGGSILAQAAALPFLADYDAICEQRRTLAAERLAVLTGELERRLPEWTFPQPLGGWTVWAQLPQGSADDLAQLALRQGVAISSGRATAPDDRFACHLRLAAGPPCDLIAEGVRRLADAWHELITLPRTTSNEPAVMV